MFLKHLPKRHALLFLGDAFLISIAYFLSPSIRFGILAYGIEKLSFGGAAVLVIYLFVFYTANLYDFDLKFKSPRYLFRFLIAIAVAVAIVTVLFFFLPGLRHQIYGRGVSLINACLVGILTYLWRLGFESVFKGFLGKQKRILIVGVGRAGKALYEIVKDNQDYMVVGFIDDDPSKQGVFNSPRVLGGCMVLDEMITAHRVDSVVLAITHMKGPALLKCLMHSKMEGVDVYNMPDFYEEITGKLPIEHVNDFWFVNTPMAGVKKNVYTRKGKKMLDIICSVLGIFLSLPIIVVTAVAIKLESSGPVLYRQRRVGLNGEIFDLIKFRSMRVDAEKDKAVWAEKADSRVTRVGKIIRKLRIDEIPQVWNVLKGEMSFIGPRPERPEFIEALEEKIQYYALRHSIKPGITGWAQVSYPYGASEKDALEKLKYDFFYMKNLTPLLDFHILLKTFRVVLFGRGAR